MFTEGYFVAEPRPDGSPGKPFASQEHGAILLFDDKSDVVAAMDKIRPKFPKAKVYRLNVVLVGEVVL